MNTVQKLIKIKKDYESLQPEITGKWFCDETQINI